MPRRKRKIKSKVLSRSSPRKRRGRRKSRRWKLEVDSETKRGVVAILLAVVAVLSILSYVHAAGRIGEWWLTVLKRAFGIEAYIVPIVVAILAFVSLDPERLNIKKSTYIGVALSVLALAAFFHLFYPLDDSLDVASQGKGGGYLGFLVSYLLRRYLGNLGSSVLLTAFFLIGLVIAFRISLRRILEALTSFKEKVFVPEEKKARPLELKVNSMSKLEGGEKEEDETQREKIEEPKKILPLFSRHIIRESKEEDMKEKSQVILSRDLSYKRPPLDIFSSASAPPNSGDIRANAKIIQRTLANFGIPVTMADVNIGPTVTQYTFKPEEGIKLSKITALQNDLALALAAHPIRIEAPIPGKSLVGIEIPNKAVSIVRLGEILASPDLKEQKSSLSFPLGRDVSGRLVFDDLERMPHLLICGATGSGKSVMIHSMVCTLLFRNSPNIVRFILVDPKRVELPVYNGIPHLLTPVVVDPDKTINALKWGIGEMDRRYQLISKTHKRDIISYNLDAKREQYLPFILIVIDELADIMARNASEVEGAIVRLAQMARAVGIHLVVATQRPSVDVITGLIKANITARIAFNVASSIDSRTVLDTSGAEKLLGNGDMLYLSGESSKVKRIQGAYVSEKEVKSLVEFLSETQKEVEYDEEVTKPPKGPEGIMGVEDEMVDDELFSEAKRVVLEAGKGSASLLQRRLRIGYARAARLLDLLEEKRIVGPPDGSKPREVIGPEKDDETRDEVIREDGYGVDEEEEWE